VSGAGLELNGLIIAGRTVAVKVGSQASKSYLQPRFVGLEGVERRHDGVDVDVRHHDADARLLAAVRELDARHVEPTAARKPLHHIIRCLCLLHILSFKRMTITTAACDCSHHQACISSSAD